jgi:hypothetical protein
MVRQNNGERGKVSVPAKRVPYGRVRSYNRKAGSRAEGPRLAAEDGVSDDARRNEPWKSQGPLGEGGSEAEEMAVLNVKSFVRRRQLEWPLCFGRGGGKQP